jgi:Protein of unknown function (DUF4244)
MYASRRPAKGSSEGSSEGSAAGRPRSVGSGRIRRWRRAAADAGMATAEYAVVTVAACGFAGLLVAILRSGEVRGLLLGIIRSALAR